MQVNFPSQGINFTNQNISVSEKEQASNPTEDKTELADAAAQQRTEEVALERTEQLAGVDETQSRVLDLYA
jgi:hypothetical protein